MVMMTASSQNFGQRLVSEFCLLRKSPVSVDVIDSLKYVSRNHFFLPKRTLRGTFSNLKSKFGAYRMVRS